MGIIIHCICLQMPVIIGLINSQHNVMFVNANKDVHEKLFGLFEANQINNVKM